MSRREWRYTNDRRDPCVLCVQWDEGPDSNDPADEATPVWPDGAIVERVFDGVHKDCLRDAVRYTDEAARHA